MTDRHAIEQSQAQLLRRIAARDKTALTDLYDQTSAVIYSTALRMLARLSQLTSQNDFFQAEA